MEKFLCYVLRFLGIGGLISWPVIFVLIEVFRGFKPGGPVGGPSNGQWLYCAIVLLVTSLYYIVVTTTATRWSIYLGVPVHLAHLRSIFILTHTDGRMLFIPILTIGPVFWIAYAITRLARPAEIHQKP